jgi:hypothetical protein
LAEGSFGAGHLNIARAENANGGVPRTRWSRTHLEVVAFALIAGPENAYVALERAGLNFVLATGIVRGREASALKEIETRKVPVWIRCFPAFYGIEYPGSSGRTDENAVSGILLERRAIAVGTAIQKDILFSGVDIAINLVAKVVCRK